MGPPQKWSWKRTPPPPEVVVEEDPPEVVVEQDQLRSTAMQAGGMPEKEGFLVI